MRQHTRTVAAVSSVGGDVDRLARFVEKARGAGADALAVIGDFGGPTRPGPEAWRRALVVLGEGNLPAFFVPGPGDQPVHEYLAECYNAEIVFPHLRGVHGSFAFGPGHVLFGGLGGEIEDDRSRIEPGGKRLVQPGWEAEYRLKVLQEFKDYLRVFLFATPPAHKGLHASGSTTLEELIKTHSPRAVIVPGEDPRGVELGRSLVAAAPPLASGTAALVDIHDRQVATLRFD